MTATVPNVSALTALVGAKAAPSKTPVQPGFAAALSTAQQAIGKPVVGPDGEHEDNRQRQQTPAKGNQGETPQHPTLRSRQTVSHRPAAPAKRQPVTAHPLVENDQAGGAAVQAPPAAVTPAVGEQPTPTTAVAGAGTGATAGSADANAEAAATQPADAPSVPAVRPAADQTALPEASPAPDTSAATAPPVAAAPAPVTDRETAGRTDPTTATPTQAAPATAAAQPEAPGQPTPVPVPSAAPPVTPEAPTSAAAQGNAPATAAAQVTVTAVAPQHRHAGETSSVAPQPGAPGTPTSTSTAADHGGAAGNETRENPGSSAKDAAPIAHARPGSAAQPLGGPATPYSAVADRSATTADSGAPSSAPELAELPATQALPAGTLDRIHAAEHSVRVQVETDGFGRVTADLHSRPGEIGVHLNVPDDAGRALMAQRMDALRTSLGQSGSAVHLSLAAQDQSSQSFPGQQGSTPREDRAQAPSAPQPHDAATPRATDGSPVTSAPADGSRLVDVRA